MKSFSLYDPYNYLVKYYSHYGKVSGLLLAHKHNLPVSTDGWICTSPKNSTNHLLYSVGENKLICRPDAPMGIGNKLPQGKDLKIEEVLPFCEEIQKICKDAIILVFEHPSILLTGKYIPRYQTSGGIMVVIDKQNDNIYIEYVGPGFDVGDLTRGKHVHTSMTIPIKEISESPAYIFRLNKYNLIGRRYDITDVQYFASRQMRIKELKTNLKEDKAQNIESYIPSKTPYLSFGIFKQILNNCIEQILYSEDPALKMPVGIMMNIYDRKFYVFEIWRTIRSILP